MRKKWWAQAISEVAAPWVQNTAFFAVLAIYSGAWVAGAIAALGTGIVPMGIIALMMRQGRVTDHHVTTRTQRRSVFAAFAVVVGAVLIGVAALTDSRPIIVGLTSALVFLAIFAAVTVVGKIKASVHVGLWVCLSLFCAVIISPWWALALLAVPPIAWARHYIRHHTTGELVTGALTGAATMALCVAVFGSLL